NGALIQGNDVNLIAGKDLNNAGTLRASNNLSAVAGNDLVNSGLVEAGNRLDLLAGNNLVNKAGGIIAGRDVSLTAIKGDVINERSVTTHESASDSRSEQRGFVDSAARIEAANNLAINAGRDFNNTGGVLKSGADTTISAGRDVNIASAEQIDSNEAGPNHRNQTITQYGSSVDVGRDLKVDAGRDISAIASQIDAKRDIAMSATENLTLASAADEQHSYSKTKEVKSQEDHVHQVSTTLTAGGNVALNAGKDMTLISSRISAGDEAYLVAGDKLELLAAQDSDYSLYDMKKKGSWGSKKTQHDEVTQVTNIGSEIKSGGDLTLKSGGDQRYQGAKLQSGNNLTLDSGGSITFEAVKDLHQESHSKSDSNMAWMSMSGEGSTDETLRQSQLMAKGQTVIKAVEGLHIDVKQVDQQTVSQTIDAMVKADPQLAWLKDAEARGDVDWRKVEEIHQSFKYQHSGLGAASQLILAILLAVVTGGAGAALVGAAEGSVTAAIADAAFISLEATAANSAISNKGNLGAVFKDTFSSESLKNAAVSGLAAGAMDYADSNWFESASGATNGGSEVTGAGPIQNPGYSKDMLSWSNAGQTILRSGTHALINSGISTAINGGSFGTNLGNAAVGEGIDLAAAAGNNAIGDLAKGLEVAPALAEKLVLHAVLGGLISKASGQDFASGAIAGGVAEGLAPLANAMLADYVSTHFDANDLSLQGSQAKIATAQIIGLLAASMAGGNAATGSLIGGAGEKYNNELHQNQVEEAEYELLKEEGLPIPLALRAELGKPIEPASTIGLSLSGARASTGSTDPGLTPGGAGAVSGGAKFPGSDSTGAKEAASDGVDLSLSYKSGWTDAQRAAADAKVRILNDADTVLTTPVRSGTSAASRYRQAGNTVPTGSDVDHMVDLQLGGTDTISNMSPLDMSVNRSLGAQIYQQTKGLQLGTKINNVKIGD
ncbi:DUF637 domain-containing protein, partial [Pseudomonas fluorescens]|uniref:DUF637 domain-containing protein n=1 Tax=Pseudomonas fluorescens TaxID=294 RepID=UPI003CFCEA22